MSNPFQVGDRVRLKSSLRHVTGWALRNGMEFEGVRTVRSVEESGVRLVENTRDDGNGNYHYTFLELVEEDERVSHTFAVGEYVTLKSDSRYLHQQTPSDYGIVTRVATLESSMRIKWQHGYEDNYPYSHVLHYQEGGEQVPRTYQVGDKVILSGYEATFTDEDNGGGRWSLHEAMKFEGIRTISRVNGHYVNVQEDNDWNYHIKYLSLVSAVASASAAPAPQNDNVAIFEKGDYVRFKAALNDKRGRENYSPARVFTGALRVTRDLLQNNNGGMIRLANDRSYYPEELELHDTAFELGDAVDMITSSIYIGQKTGIGTVSSGHIEAIGGSDWVEVEWENGIKYKYPTTDLINLSKKDNTRFKAMFKDKDARTITATRVRASNEEEAVRIAEMFMLKEEIHGVYSISVVVI